MVSPRIWLIALFPVALLAASGDDPGIFLLSPDSGAKPGMKVS